MGKVLASRKNSDILFQGMLIGVIGKLQSECKWHLKEKGDFYEL